MQSKFLKKKKINVDYKPGIKNLELLKIIKNYDGLAVRSNTQVTRQLLENAEKLKIIGRAGIGTDNIDKDAATEKGVIVMNTPFGNAVTTAEHTIAMIMSLVRMIPSADYSTRQGKWEKSKFNGIEITNKILGLVGCGNVGSIVANRAIGLKMKVIAFDPFLNIKRAEEIGIEKVTLDDLLKKSDIISLHTPLTNETKNIISAEAINKMKKGAKLVNCARGGLVDEYVCRAALESGHLSGAAFDVFTEEPATNNILFDAPNFIATPHLGASTKEAQENVAVQIAEQMSDFLNSGAISNALNFPITDFEKFNEIKYYLKLSEKLGAIQSQLSSKAIKSIIIELYGNIKESKTIMLAFVKGILSHRNPDRVNYINAETLLKENNINVTYSFSNENVSYENMINTVVKSDDDELKICASLFQGNRPRLVNLFGYELDIEPNGIMLFIKNIDRPGVIGKIGTILGDAKINIKEFLLSKKKSSELAFSVVRLDLIPSQQVIDQINSLDEVQSIQLLNC